MNGQFHGEIVAHICFDAFQVGFSPFLGVVVSGITVS